MIDLWYALHSLFDTDDGSLPEIWIDDLSDLGVENIFAFLRSRGTTLPEEPCYWDYRLQREMPIDSVPNAAQLVIQGEAAPFHVVMQGLSFSETTIPDLGIFIFSQRIIIDYRMGSAWGPAELIALFEMFKEIHRLDPDATIRLPHEVLPTMRSQFERVWHDYLSALS
jgi:hypothetical protein